MAGRTLPVVGIERIGDAPPKGLPSGERPLAGVRALDLTRVIAGPVCGRTLAAHGADVLLVTARHLPAIHSLVIDTGRGKLSSAIDLREPEGLRILQGLLEEADVIVQAYRPGSLQSKGLGPREAARIRPGIVYVSLSAYGHTGPWAARRGFDSLVQTATGFNIAEALAASVDEPKVLPAQVLDHASGYLMAFGAMAGLYRRALEGGSWHVRVSLAGTGRWLRALGRVGKGWDCRDPRFEDVADLLEESDSGFGRLTSVRHAAQLSANPARWVRPTRTLGANAPAWPG
jgi:crotonobetainyl-CoA:carnitine CoA-transferase CaiB-like acyl-CoA transferase